MPPLKWTFKACQEEALKYNTVKDFREHNSKAYCSCSKKEFYYDIINHFETSGCKYKRYIYAYEFPDNHVYVGLTYNFKERNRGHEKEGTVFDYGQESGLQPNFRQLIDEPVDVNEAVKLEEYYLNEYLQKGWVKLNKAKTGSVGGGFEKWNHKNTLEEAVKYKTRTEFQKESAGAYSSAWKNGWLDEVCKHMDSGKKPNNYWTKDKCKEAASLYNNRAEFRKNDFTAFKAAHRRGWINEICSHMELLHKPKGYWTLEKCIEAAKDCKNLTEFQKKTPTAYDVTLRNKWSHIIKEYFKKDV